MLLNIPFFTDTDYDSSRNMLHWWEIVLVPLYFILFVKLGKRYYNKKDPTGADKKLFTTGLKIKMAGATFITLIYNLYYSGGDTTGYFNDGQLLDRLLFHDPVTAIRFFFVSGKNALWPDDLLDIISNFRMAFAENTWIIAKLSAFFSLFCFQSMLCTALFFAFFAYLCIWKFYTTLSQMYPNLKKKFAIVIIFVPSVIIWGSGIFKDTVTISAMFLLFCSTYQIFFKHKQIVKNTAIMLCAGYLLFIIKDYILFSFSVSIMIWLLISWAYSFKTKLFRGAFLFFIIAATVISSFFMIRYIGSEIAELAVKNLLENTVSTGKYLQAVSDQENGSGYDIGIAEPTIHGFIVIAPKAINVTLFRPYLWESGKLLIFFSALESTLIFVYFLYVLFRNKIIFFFTKIAGDPFLILCIFFTLVFSIFVGISSFNFGSLTRYKIPCIPFFLAALVILDGKRKRAIGPLA
ncbi:MAG TPA: hypothetical protein VK718_08885 [Ferruginibacter sp.]|nr:hypothetical protein [Ferruginibacter sp.]